VHDCSHDAVDIVLLDLVWLVGKYYLGVAVFYKDGVLFLTHDLINWNFQLILNLIFICNLNSSFSDVVVSEELVDGFCVLLESLCVKNGCLISDTPLASKRLWHLSSSSCLIIHNPWGTARLIVLSELQRLSSLVI